MKKIHVHEEKHDGKALRQLRNALHVGPYEVAHVANLTRVQIDELERGDWGNWNNLTRQEALDRYLDALARIERIQTEPPARFHNPSSSVGNTLSTRHIYHRKQDAFRSLRYATAQ